jgi:hypothetical protein
MNLIWLAVSNMNSVFRYDLVCMLSGIVGQAPVSRSGAGEKHEIIISFRPSD